MTMVAWSREDVWYSAWGQTPIRQEYLAGYSGQKPCTWCEMVEFAPVT